jgi:hypothetical protein
VTVCPACGEELFGWLQASAPGDRAKVLLKRCERCGLGLRDDRAPADAPTLLLGDLDLTEGTVEVRVPNRDSVQARLGGRHWAAIDPGRRLYATPRSLRALVQAAGASIISLRTPGRGRGQTWMWQTLVNAFTLNENFARGALTGGLRPAGVAQALKFAIDAVVTVLLAVPVALVSTPLELVSALAGRGGELVAVVVIGRPPGGSPTAVL